MDVNATNMTTGLCSDGVSAPDQDPTAAVFRDQTRFWVQRVLIPIVVPIGILGNLATIVVMSRPRMRSSTSHYLAALAVFDLVYLGAVFTLSLTHYPSLSSSAAYWRGWPVWIAVTDTSSNTSIWLTVTFTVERYVAVCHPMRGKILCTESRAKRLIFFVMLICILITLPTMFEWEVCFKNGIFRPIMTQMGKSDLYRSVYYWTTALLFTLIPLILLVIFNSFLIQSVRYSSTLRRTLTHRRDIATEGSSPSSQERKITIMLIAVVVLFLICQLPTAIMLLISIFFTPPEGSGDLAIQQGLGNIFNFLMTVNATGNFVLYSLLSQKYRRTFLQTFCPCLKGRMSRLRSVYQNTIYSTVPESPQRPQRLISLQPLSAAAWSKSSQQDQP
ncbi:hypothetical protein LAZ67_2000262 [Cordylochernes scorpioides]|uniref:G-protein coupled receptors family 1 profile domain-containing protein n=1 Tax=Cordylochernes scorpioides TaxID=51811 RepID=A0ABY6K0N5_9ARAC|nr:hypothetical protein LAZ67_2000262 [Cordylochernes scorpioides]